MATHPLLDDRMPNLWYRNQEIIIFLGKNRKILLEWLWHKARLTHLYLEQHIAIWLAD